MNLSKRCREAVDSLAWELAMDFIATQREGIEELTSDRTIALYQEHVKDHFFDAIIHTGTETAWDSGLLCLEQPHDFADALDQDARVESLLGDR